MATITADEFKNRTTLFQGDTVVVSETKSFKIVNCYFQMNLDGTVSVTVLVDWSNNGKSGSDQVSLEHLKKLLE